MGHRCRHRRNSYQMYASTVHMTSCLFPGFIVRQSGRAHLDQTFSCMLLNACSCCTVQALEGGRAPLDQVRQMVGHAQDVASKLATAAGAAEALQPSTSAPSAGRGLAAGKPTAAASSQQGGKGKGKQLQPGPVVSSASVAGPASTSAEQQKDQPASSVHGFSTAGSSAGSVAPALTPGKQLPQSQPQLTIPEKPKAPPRKGGLSLFLAGALDKRMPAPVIG